MRIVAALVVAAPMASCAQARSGGSPDRSVNRTAWTSSANPVLFNTESFKYDYAGSAVTAAAAHRYRVIVLQATDGNKVARLKAANPGAKILLYQLVSNARSTDPQGATTCTPYAGDSARHPEWFLTDQRGARIEDTTYAGSLPMDVGSFAYEHACVASASREPSATASTGSTSTASPRGSAGPCLRACARRGIRTCAAGRRQCSG
jgi:hypothetical protein